jgi:hypothetical protein
MHQVLQFELGENYGKRKKGGNSRLYRMEGRDLADLFARVEEISSNGFHDDVYIIQL